ncbi:hypothetical protein A2331_03905 [Candidatus Falkowbacteria bacterium RIFOXYB2_FULL_34_18]|uniref:HTH merR-type domain-containing protein n=1 Tax=Candidatus Falkowbacteria bacterium RIFOXYD2_FULL_34_120 TaxID=1798007 RepID=A0A1F5TPN1_9BACT|nr:MAG: hypothetical protein A2331_03905 [Candidatus Falkowbacteria bacterium RIFOXYB2_FULL_34_18]OGF29095.1 MAG: hypothetical protein A2500_03230 [Candidatus Falkowbacteria bacterium RIFOXYC12_FULL_34_55]OGF36178.1 MAG: hypothetical protein A2466_04760 [Candidatus Falkowbacteria bacterium RIFOXYC2_FULL_34_220]OGF38605.1 MAG: hypothetical protein A2515_02120 [Candidatus Falkowbacteria bacterium RIFOXYD12_FULL_34_57]OGF40788.1 MAG: hypothetical protein A2531_06765 [Candidatus Falkowbacteria bact
MKLYLNSNPEIKHKLANYPGLCNALNKKNFKVKDSLLTYRQINTLSKDGVIIESRKSDKEWRKFSFKEIIYLNLVKKFKDFGLTNKQLLNFKKFILESKEFEEAIAYAFIGLNLVVIFENKNNNYACYLWDYYSVLTKYDSNYLVFNLTKQVIELKENPKSKEIFNFFLDIRNYENHLSEKEKEFIQTLQNNDYEEIVIKKDNEGKVTKVYTNKNYSDKAYSEKEMLDIIKSKKWAKFEIVKTDGRIVSIKEKEIFKY